MSEKTSWKNSRQTTARYSLGHCNIVTQLIRARGGGYQAHTRIDLQRSVANQYRSDSLLPVHYQLYNYYRLNQRQWKSSRLLQAIELLLVESVLVETQFTTGLLPVVQLLLVELVLLKIWCFTTSLLPVVELFLLELILINTDLVV